MIEDQRRRHAERLEQYEQLRVVRATDDLPPGGGRRATLELDIGCELAAFVWLEGLPAHSGIDGPHAAGGA